MINQRPRATEAAKAPNERQPHHVDRAANQPYAKEHEDYDEGVHRPPVENPAHPPPVGDEPAKKRR